VLAMMSGIVFPSATSFLISVMSLRFPCSGFVPISSHVSSFVQ